MINIAIHAVMYSLTILRIIIDNIVMCSHAWNFKHLRMTFSKYCSFACYPRLPNDMMKHYFVFTEFLVAAHLRIVTIKSTMQAPMLFLRKQSSNHVIKHETLYHIQFWTQNLKY